MDVADVGTFPACLDISIFLLRKGTDGKIATLAPRDGPSYAFTFLSNGTESWSDDSVWETLREQTHAQICSWIGPSGGQLLESQWSEGDVRLRWRCVAKRFRLIVILRPLLLWHLPQDVRVWIA